MILKAFSDLNNSMISCSDGWGFFWSLRTWRDAGSGAERGVQLAAARRDDCKGLGAAGRELWGRTRSMGGCVDGEWLNSLLCTVAHVCSRGVLC